jgi:hypothetical protein
MACIATLTRFCGFDTPHKQSSIESLLIMAFIVIEDGKPCLSGWQINLSSHDELVLARQ